MGLLPILHAHSRGILILAMALLPISHAHSLHHSRGILILAMVLLLVLSPGPLYAQLKWHVSCVDFLSNFHNCSHCYLFRPKPTCAHSRDNTVKLSWACHHYCLFWIYIINIYVFVISYNITPDHKYCSLIHHLVATHHIRHNAICCFGDLNFT